MKQFFTELRIKGHSLATLGERMGVSRQRVEQWEGRGWFPIQHKATLDDIASSCGIEPLPNKYYVNRD